MTDQCEFFPCQKGDDIAFVFYDHGIRQSIDALNVCQQVKFDLTYKAPNDKRLPASEEYDAVNGVEDRVEAFAGEHGGSYVGRVTMAGHRYFSRSSMFPWNSWSGLQMT